MCITLCLYCLFTEKCLISRFMESVTKRRQFFVLHFLLKLECGPQEIISREICLYSSPGGNLVPRAFPIEFGRERGCPGGSPLSDLMGCETKTSRDLVARSTASRPKRLASLAKRSTCSKATYIRTSSANWNWYAIKFEKTRLWR